MTDVLARVTTEYVAREDRIRLCGETRDAKIVTIWATRRLLTRLLPPLMEQLEKRTASGPCPDLLRAFAHEAARASLTPQTPVRPGPDAAWLVSAIDVAVTRETVGLTFRNADGGAARLSLRIEQFRQWLAALHAAWIAAEWPLDAWPAWIEAPAPAAAPAVTLH